LPPGQCCHKDKKAGSVPLLLIENPFAAGVDQCDNFDSCAGAILLLALWCLSPLNTAISEEINPAALATQLAAIKEEIRAAEAEVGTTTTPRAQEFIRERIQVLKLSREMIESYLISKATGATFSYEYRLAEPDTSRLNEILRELVDNRQRLVEAQKTNTGAPGFIGALAEMQVQTMKQTEALLMQAALGARFGFVRPSTQGPGTRPPEPPAAPANASEPDNNCLDLSNIGSSVMDRNSVFVEVGWKTDITNNCARDMAVDVRAIFIDPAGFEVDDDRTSIEVKAGSTETARGRTLISPVSKFDANLTTRIEITWR
jgi:hypothetical protein